LLVEFFHLGELKCTNVRFYSVKIGENPNTEYREFVLKTRETELDRIDLAELQEYTINTIGHNPLGAETRFFKKEDFADRIRQPTPDSYDPNKPDPKNYGLRNFCLRLSNKVVILFNGNRKTYLDVRNCPNCRNNFDMANKLSKAIDEAIYNRNIIIDGFDIGYEPDDFELLI
jgi:hypothetical protein